MKRTVNRLPKDAVYDFRNEYGEKVYHTKRRNYYVATSWSYGKRHTQIVSTSRD